MANRVSKVPTSDDKHFHRNKKTAWLSYHDKLTAWLWQVDKGAARWTLNVDDGHRPATVARGVRVPESDFESRASEPPSQCQPESR